MHTKKLRPLAWALFMVSSVLLAGGCDLIGPAKVKVRLVNESAFAVDPQLYRSSSLTQDDPLFVETNLYTEFAKGVVPGVPSGKTIEFSLDCEAAVRLGLARPVFAGGGDSKASQTIAGTIPLSGAGQHYACGDTVTFTFRDGPEGPTVAYAVTSP